MSKSSYTPVSFKGGPRDGESVEIAGEPRRTLGHPGSAGHYSFEFDREDGLRKRSGRYTWSAAKGDDLAEPTDGDTASALLDLADGNVTTKPGASTALVPDVTAEKAEATIADVRDQQAAAELAAAPVGVVSSPDLANGPQSAAQGQDGPSPSKSTSAPKAPPANPSGSAASKSK
jgi:hypothetical protein